MSCITPSEYTQVIVRKEVVDFCVRCMEKVSVCHSHSESLANVLVAGDYRGHYSHGLNRLEMYVADIQKGVCVYNKEPVIIKETVSTALVNGENLLGPVVGNFAMELAIKKARSTGIGWVAANGSNHYGIAGWYSLMAAKEGLIGMSFTNTSPLVYPTRSKGIRLVALFCGEPLQRLPLLSVRCTLCTRQNCSRLNVKLITSNKANMSCITPSEYTQVIVRKEVVDFCVRCMEKVSVCHSHSESLANVLVAGDYRGHYSHGLNRLEMYVADIQKGVCVYNKEPVIIKETVSTALVNGENLLGPVVGNFAMELAIKKARSTGIGWVAANGSNHYGIAGWYSLMAAKEGLIGMSFTNTSPLVYPTRSKGRALGTNPLTVAAPSSKPGDECIRDRL
ncbi:hypothetical protein AHF37_07510 [Paragonimus kellicotti]|nr:hypothetical protein AHF37_07510 [Paragonimus kellicotti]